MGDLFSEVASIARDAGTTTQCVYLGAGATRLRHGI